MINEPDYVTKNRVTWTGFAEGFKEDGRRSWADGIFTWGIWNVREDELNVLGGIERFCGKDVIELGCGTAYISSWFARAGAKPVGVDITPAQLDSAREFQEEFGYRFPLIEASAEEVPLPDFSFDLAISEYGASIWCDPYRWIPEAARLLRPGGELVFLRNSTISMICMPDEGTVTTSLQRNWFDLHRLEWDNDGSVEFHLPTGAMFQCLLQSGFSIENIIEIEPPRDAPETRFEYMDLNWGKRWPAEEIWVVRKQS